MNKIFILNKTLSDLIYYSGFNWIYKKITDRDIPIIFYHEVGNDILPRFSIPQDIFEAHVRWLSKHYNIVSIDNLVKHVKGEIKLKGKIAAITFDGGWIGTYKNAYPILKKYNAPATVYIITDLIEGNLPWNMGLIFIIHLTSKKSFKFQFDSETYEFGLHTREQKRFARLKINAYMIKLDNEERKKIILELADKLEVDISQLPKKLFMSWEQVQKLNNDSLITIGSHTLTHQRLTELSYKECWAEIYESKIKIENKLNSKVTSFCYPDGRVSEEIKSLVKKAGYESGLGVRNKNIKSDLNKVGDDVYELKRISLPNLSFNPAIATEVSGVMRVIKNTAKSIIQKNE